MNQTLWHFISAGLLLGLSAGVSPGPLLTLVLQQSLKHKSIDGIKVALSPLITDIPIISICWLLVNQMIQYELMFNVLSVVGGIYIAYLGIMSFKVRGLDLNVEQGESQSLKKGIVANFLNPSPYLFWISVGTPLLLKAVQLHWSYAFGFMISFYSLLVGSKVVIAVITGRTKHFMNTRVYVWVMRVLGVALLGFGFMLLWEGLSVRMYSYA